MSISNPIAKARRAAFTLMETMIAVTIMGLASVGIGTFLVQGVKVYYADRAVTIVNRDIRTFTQQLDTDAVESNYFCLYPDFNTRADSSGNDLSLADGQVGDFAVFVFTDPSQARFGVSMITRLVGYYREITNTTLNTGPVHRFDIDLSANPVDATSATMASILNQKVGGTISSYPVVTQIAQGLATNTTGSTPVPKLFYNFKNRSVMIDAQISESLNEQSLSTATLGNTYNFTVSPRG